MPGFLSLPFEVECQSFTLETYDGQRPKMFRSVLNFYENDVRVATAKIGVNTPFVFKGMTFYQASYSEAGVGSVALRVFRDESGGSQGKDGSPARSFELVEKVIPGELYRIDGDAAFRVTQLEKDLMNLGPAARMEFFSSRNQKKGDQFWIFQKLPGFDFAHRKVSKIHFVLENLNPKYSTGLSVARDPGAWVVWVGCSIMLLAMFMAVYTLHSRYWVTYTRENGFVIVGWSNKLMLFTPRFERFFGLFKKGLLEGK